MKIKWKTLLISIAIPLLVGAVAGLLTMNSMEQFSQLVKPLLSPPGWLFPVVWTILYTLMGIASYLVYTSGAPKGQVSSALTRYALQLAVNFFWSIFFFVFNWYLFSFFWLVLLWILVFATLISFYRVSKPAGWLLLPYLLWVTFAAYLNLFIYLLN